MVMKIAVIVIICLIGVGVSKKLSMDSLVRPLSWMLFVLPFCTGGFYAPVCTVTAAFLLGYLVWAKQKNKFFQVRFNYAFLTVLILALSYSLSFLWAADRGMAVWGMVRFLPVLLFTLALEQLKPEQRTSIYRLVPLSAAIMTILTCLMQYIPSWTELVTVNGRLAGFFEYPNVYAVFLIAALIISATDSERGIWSVCLDAVLILGIFESGSRTGFIVLLFVLLGLCIVKRNKKYSICMAMILLVCMSASLILGKLGFDTSSNRYLTISMESSTMLGRFLYFADALKVIARNPFGLGYLGYHAVQGSVQSGVYDVTYIHNWMLQMLLDVGWIPAILFAAVAICSFFSKNTDIRSKFLLIAILGHGMMDFDMEFLIIWLLLLPALELERGKSLFVKQGKIPAVAAGIALCLCSGWLSAGDALYRNGRVEQCLQVTPFHTQALEYRLTEITDMRELDLTASSVLELNPTSSIAYSAKANAAYAAGDIGGMIDAKEQAIACARYQIEEYCDYFDKLYNAMTWYLAMDDAQSADVCASYLLSIPTRLSELKEKTSPLAWKLVDQPQLELPEEYQIKLKEISE